MYGVQYAILFSVFTFSQRFLLIMKKYISAVPLVLSRLALQGHQLSVHGPQDVDRALVHVPLRVGVRLLSR
jgi:hypothetical protein